MRTKNSMCLALALLVACLQICYAVSFNSNSLGERDYVICTDSNGKSIVLYGSMLIMDGVMREIDSNTSLYYDYYNKEMYIMQKRNNACAIECLTSRKPIMTIANTMFSNRGKWCYNDEYACIRNREDGIYLSLYKGEEIKELFVANMNNEYELVRVNGCREYFAIPKVIYPNTIVYHIDVSNEFIKEIALHDKTMKPLGQIRLSSNGYSEPLSPDLYYLCGYIVDMSKKIILNTEILTRYHALAVLGKTSPHLAYLNCFSKGRYIALLHDDSANQYAELAIVSFDGQAFNIAERFAVRGFHTKILRSSIAVNGKEYAVVHNSHGIWLFDIGAEQIRSVNIEYGCIREDRVLLVDVENSLMFAYSKDAPAIVGIIPISRGDVTIKNVQFADAIYVAYSDGNLVCLDGDQYTMQWSENLAEDANIISYKGRIAVIGQDAVFIDKQRNKETDQELSGYRFVRYSRLYNHMLLQRRDGKGCAVISSKRTSFHGIEAPNTPWFTHDSYIHMSNGVMSEYSFARERIQYFPKLEEQLLYFDKSGIRYKENGVIRIWGDEEGKRIAFYDDFSHVQFESALFLFCKGNIIAVQQ